MPMTFFSFELLLCLFCGISTAICGKFDYTKVNYCAKDMECERFGVKSTNTGCGCKSNPDINEITSDLNDFRQSMVDFHNELRNYHASGSEKNNSLGTGASNMNVLNYDLELEHLARCFLMGDHGPVGYNRSQDRCRKTKVCDMQGGQNLAWRSDDKWVVNKESFHEPIQLFYDEVTLAQPNIIDKYAGHGGWGHFTQLIWATAALLGCARGCSAKAVVEGLDDAMHCVLVCNYCAKEKHMNRPDDPVYKKGKACSTCEKGKKCNSKYTSLCGELETIPQDSLEAISESTTPAPLKSTMSTPHEQRKSSTTEIYTTRKFRTHQSTSTEEFTEIISTCHHIKPIALIYPLVLICLRLIL